MKSSKLNSTTAMVLTLSFLQPLPGLAQSSSPLTCLQNFGGDPVAAEAACLEDLLLSGVVCDPSLLGAASSAGGSDGDESLEKIAERILRRANVEACATADAQAEAEAAEAAILAADAAAAEAQASAEAEAAALAAEEQASAEAEAEAAALAAQAQAEEQASAEAADAAARAQAEADAAEAEAQAAAMAEQAAAQAQAEADAEVQASADAEAEAVAEADAAAIAEDAAAQASADAEAEAADAAALAQAEAAAAAEAQANADAEAQANADAEAAAEAQASADAEAEAADAAALAQAEAEAEAAVIAAAQAREQADAAAEAAARAAAEAQECSVELVDADGAVLCADNMSEAEIAAVSTESTDDAEVAVTTEIVSEDASRTSNEEFVAAEADSTNSGPTDLERAGLFALGALVVGTILSNGQRVTAQTDDRVILQDQYGNYSVLKSDDIIVQTPGSSVRTETYNDGSMRTFITRDDGVQIVTITNAQGRVLRRSRIDTNGNEVLLIDDTRYSAPVVIETLPQPSESDFAYMNTTDSASLREALRAAERRDLGRSFSLSQVREYREVRNLAPEINLENITFRTGSAAIPASEAESLREIGLLMLDMIDENPNELFLIEGYTDAVGDESYNLLLSDRRAETVARALSEYFGVWPENMVIQGYGERFLLIPTLEAERLNRRVAVRRITDLVQPY